MTEMVEFVEELCGRLEGEEEGRGRGRGRGGRGRGKGGKGGKEYEERGGWEGRRLPTVRSLRRVMVIGEGGKLERRWEGVGEEKGKEEEGEEDEGRWGEGNFYCLRESLRGYLQREEEVGGFVEEDGEEEEGSGSGLRKETEDKRGLGEEALGEGGLGGLFD